MTMEKMTLTSKAIKGRCLQLTTIIEEICCGLYQPLIEQSSVPVTGVIAVHGIKRT